MAPNPRLVDCFPILSVHDYEIRMIPDSLSSPPPFVSSFVFLVSVPPPRRTERRRVLTRPCTAKRRVPVIKETVTLDLDC